MTARWWILTIPEADWSPPQTLPTAITFLKGQLEEGASGFRHWQAVTRTKQAMRMTGLKALFCATAHVEKTRSAAAIEYVWKDDTAVADTRFQLGEIKEAGNQVDWVAVHDLAARGQFTEIPPQVMVRHCGNLMKIHSMSARPQMRTGVISKVYWGPTGTGKTHKAYTEATADGIETYHKSGTTKWWDGYKGEKHVIIDEFDGQIGITHLLKWLDKWPCQVEIKGGSTPLCGVRFWITSNLHPSEWFPQAHPNHMAALLRRIEITEITHREDL